MGIFSDAKTIKAKKVVAGGKVDVNCQSCRKTFKARAADVARGWGKFCSKSCKAIKQEQRTGQYAQYLSGVHSDEGSNRWTDEDGNRKARQWTGWGRSVVSTTDHMTGEVSIEEFDKHGVSRGFQLSPEQLNDGGYGGFD